MSEFIKSWKFMAIIIGLLTLVCASLVVYGVTTHTEAGIATTETPITDGFVPPEYNHRPIGICVRSWSIGNGASQEDLDAVQAAVTVTNDRVGLRLLESGNISTYGGCMMVATLGAPQDVDSPQQGHTDPGGGSGVCGESCCFSTVNTGTGELTSLAIQHEIGHCLGLAHDDYPMSIMYPRQHATEGQYPPRISDSDRELLRARYTQLPTST